MMISSSLSAARAQLASLGAETALQRQLGQDPSAEGKQIAPATREFLAVGFLAYPWAHGSGPRTIFPGSKWLQITT